MEVAPHESGSEYQNKESELWSFDGVVGGVEGGGTERRVDAGTLGERNGKGRNGRDILPWRW
jgi:hypothetical protein